MKAQAFHEYLGDILAQMRQRAELSQEELARRLRDKHQSYVSKVESGQRRLDVVELCEWTAALDLDPTEIVELVRDHIASTSASRRRVKRVKVAP